MAALFQEILPSGSVLSDVPTIDRLYRRNVTALERRVPLALRPGNEDAVLRIVEVARQQR
jgi:hypothetical protein